MVAARKLQRRAVGLLVPVVSVALGAAYVARGGGDTDEIVATALSLGRLLGGLMLGGVAAAWVGARVVGRPATLRELIGPCAAAAGWAPFVYLAVLGIARLSGVGEPAPVYAAMALLLWGIAAGFGIVAGDHEVEPGRLLVASCFGLGGTILGIWAAHELPPALPVRAIRAPVEAPPVEVNRFVLVRSGDEQGPLLVLTKPGTRVRALARRNADGDLEPVGETVETLDSLRSWDITGRVFFQVGGPAGGGVLPSEQSTKPSRN